MKKNIIGTLHTFAAIHHVHNMPVGIKMIMQPKPFMLLHCTTHDYVSMIIHPDDVVYSSETSIFYPDGYLTITRRKISPVAREDDYILDLSTLKITELYHVKNISNMENYSDMLEFIIPDDAIMVYGQRCHHHNQQQPPPPPKNAKRLFMEELLQEAVTNENFALAEEIKKILGD